MRIINFDKLDLIIFLVGSIVMIFELLASRILAPYLGTSIYVWTSIIGVILGSLSLGYIIGGIYSKKNIGYSHLGILFLLLNLLFILVLIIKDPILPILSASIHDLRLVSIITCILLFTPINIVLGMILPLAAKIRITSLTSSGMSVGHLSAVGTLGNIFGTFITGFYLLPTLGINHNIFLLILISLSLSVLGLTRKRIIIFGVVLLINCIALIYFFLILPEIHKQTNTLTFESAYQHIEIVTTQQDNKPVTHIIINKIYNSGTDYSNSNLLYYYSNFFKLAEVYNPDFSKGLLFGGGGYSFPKYFISHYPTAKLDVVEIDPKVTEVAYEYFGLEDNHRLTIFHEDGRRFINTTGNKYDVIYMDAFNYYYVPYQMTTKEFVNEIHKKLNSEGIAIINLISGLEGQSSTFFRASYTTYKSIFPFVDVYRVSPSRDAGKRQNIILVAGKKPFPSNAYTLANPYLKNFYTSPIPKGMILTDDYAPVENITLKGEDIFNTY